MALFECRGEKQEVVRRLKLGPITGLAEIAGLSGLLHQNPGSHYWAGPEYIANRVYRTIFFWKLWDLGLFFGRIKSFFFDGCFLSLK
jgi:hypothetical protein